MNKKKFVVFVNDSYFSYLLSRSLFKFYSKNIELVVFSTSTKSYSKILKIFKKSSLGYFVYRSFVQIFSLYFKEKYSVRSLSKKHKLKTVTITSFSEFNDDMLSIKPEYAFCFNFDLIITKEIISKFKEGIYNIHASKLPNDKGISPVLWAFARGDDMLWSTIYRIDEGIDSGPIAKQFSIAIKNTDSSFSIYKRVCLKSGFQLKIVVDKLLSDSITLVSQKVTGKEVYHSWPDKHYASMLKTSKRKHFSMYDIFPKLR